jgi:hypothetical protein
MAVHHSGAQANDKIVIVRVPLRNPADSNRSGAAFSEFISPMNEQGAAIELIHGIDEPLWTADGD